MEKYFGNCHCGAVKFSFLSEKAVEIWKCNCSVCEPYDYQHLFIKHEDFDLISGDQDISSYKFGTKNAEHLFCKICGIKSFYQPRSGWTTVAISGASPQQASAGIMSVAVAPSDPCDGD